ncbi:hypothetical protein A2960_01040 [Candidatus Gottesmanbacteria bacterium RIFCSPLOWO2_01_FULL_39_12b]|uniref:Glycosyltransferase subfamily 4-like N-terminal domain-containing protein n=1 Tax=Candidatus Gottesmanbacteria bacterium RIFCSPLOWO2_01_FULL_39_12b TaxID=1798388 RepID=A0A1F6APX5_9BACT|nr:MAG: hypothetical protein A2960_01040 [Candidatus Gottesmanbacteria bacterium RIFCSPLOWO2_01_FULL_39_12b]
MKILMLTPYLPYPLLSGGQIRTYNLLKNLSHKHEITLFSFIRNEKEKQYINRLKEYCVAVEVFLKRPPWTLTSLALSAVTFYPLVVCMYLNKVVKEAIAKAIEIERFDLIHAETFYVMPNIPNYSVPIILIEQTIEYLVYQHYTELVSFIPKRILMDWDVAKIHFWEKRFWKKATRVVAMSTSDKQVMQNLVSDLKVDLVPNGVDTTFFSGKRRKEKKQDKTILFVGNFKWLQNREAVSILVKDIWPHIKKDLPQAKLWIVGRYPSEEILNFASSSIIVSQDIDDIREVYKKSDVLLAPLYGPGGTRFKILESMAAGLPVVTTATGIEGLGARHGYHALISNDKKSLALETVRLLTHRSLYQKLAENGRKLVEKNFNWIGIANSLDRIYKEAAQENEN